MNVVMEHERVQGKQVYDVHEKNLGYDVTSLDLVTGELRLIEVKGLAAENRDDPAHPERAEGRRGPEGLLLAVHRDQLCWRPGNAGTHPGPSQVPVARGQQRCSTTGYG